jgi:C4-dicarboxylate-specific signal transduction histidine kinase
MRPSRAIGNLSNPQMCPLNIDVIRSAILKWRKSVAIRRIGGGIPPEITDKLFQPFSERSRPAKARVGIVD